MKYIKIIIPALAALLCSAAAAKGIYRYTEVKGDPMHSRIYTLDNGLRVYMSVNHVTPRLQTYIAVKTGSRNDPPETTGLAHYLEHLMFKGTTHFGSSDVKAEAPLLDTIENRFESYRRIKDPAMRKRAYHEIDSISQLAARYNIPNEYDKMMAAIGSEGSNAYTSEDVTCYQENIPSNEIETWAKIQADRFMNMVIRGFHTELEAVYEEYNIGLASDGEKEWVALSRKLFPRHPYGTQTTIGTQEHLKNPSITNIKRYFSRYYVPDNVAICLSGDFDPDSVIRVIDRYFGPWKKSGNVTFPQYAPLPALTANIDTTVTGLEAPNVMLGWRTAAASALQRDTLEVIARMLSNGKAGLFDLGLNAPMRVMSAEAGLQSDHDYGIFLLEGTPKEGQSLEEVRSLMLSQIDRLKRGKFSDGLLPAVVNNMKLAYYQGLRSNEIRAGRFVSAFINDDDWEARVHAFDRISKMTKAQISEFARHFFSSGYVTVFKRQGNDTTIHKIEKPEITPIPTNNNRQSAFLREIVSTKTAPIEPRFADFKKDMTAGRTSRGLEFLYRKNNGDGLFSLTFHYPLGSENDSRLAVAADYLAYTGTGRLTNEEINSRFYSLACSYGIDVSADAVDISLSGLDSNMPQALSLLETLIRDAKADSASYRKYVGLLLKARSDARTNQRANFAALCDLGEYGTYNPHLNIMTQEQLQSADPQALLSLLSSLMDYRHTVMYFGPRDMKQVDRTLGKVHSIPQHFSEVPAAKPYLHEATHKTEVWLAHYDAKNIYMTMYHNEGRKWSPDKAAVEALFNEYFGGGMNAIVFQELREARGLAYSAGAHYAVPAVHPLSDAESFTTRIITQNDKMSDCISEFRTLLDSVPAREAGFTLARQNLMKTLATERTTYDGIFRKWLQAKRLGIDYDIDRKIYETLPKLSMSDLLSFARDNISRKPYRFLILGDENNLDIDALKKLGPVRKVTAGEIFGY